ncbi:MAG: hypothetical protein V2B20_05735 [Pseudomonadota bacterium]
MKRKKRKTGPPRRSPVFPGEKREEIKHNNLSIYHANLKQSLIIIYIQQLTLKTGKICSPNGGNNVQLFELATKKVTIALPLAAI